MTTKSTTSGDNPGTLRDDPVIVLGMHHSGTSILAEILHRSGVFMHANMRHHESKLFTRMNDQVILGGGDNWARLPPVPVNQMMSKVAMVRNTIERKAWRRYHDAGYDGQSRWGFKDPRTCLILPVYLEIFPRAQLLHIIRNEHDVAASLARTSKKGVGFIKDVSFWKSIRSAYLERARQAGAQFTKYFEFHYEDFCDDPAKSMSSVFAYLDLILSDTTRTFLREHIYRPDGAVPAGADLEQK